MNYPRLIIFCYYSFSGTTVAIGGYVTKGRILVPSFRINNPSMQTKFYYNVMIRQITSMKSNILEQIKT